MPLIGTAGRYLQTVQSGFRISRIKQVFVSAKETTQSRSNNFGALRIFAALLVIWGHGQELKGLMPPILWQAAISKTGLDIFFCLSGFLILDSWVRDPRPGAFLIKRMLRIFPALVVCVLATVFLVGPVFTELSLWDYVSNRKTWLYLLNILLHLELYLPGVFTMRVGRAVNGSLWSLFPEFLCYVTIPLIWLLPRYGRGAALLMLMVGCGAAGLYLFDYPHPRMGLFYGADPRYVLVQVPFFMAGAFIRLLQQRWPDVLRADLAVLCCASIFLLPPWLQQMSIPVEWLTLAYVVITFGTLSTPGLRSATRFGDLSYGLYLYAFPVQQMLLERLHAFSIVLCTIIALTIAWLSWHLVEHPALRRKPARGRRPDIAVAPPAIQTMLASYDAAGTGPSIHDDIAPATSMQFDAPPRMVTSVSSSNMVQQRPVLTGPFNPARNNFDAIRLLAALVVLLSHSYSLTGASWEPVSTYLHYGYGGTLAVAVFFVISGFLIARSAQAQTLQVYLRSRVLRIIPALALVTVLEAFVLGPIFFDGSINYYLRHFAVPHLSNILVFGEDPYIAGVFQKLHYPYVNGSLWTLPVESLFYLVLPLVLLATSARRHWILLLWLASLAAEPLARWHGLNDDQFGGFLFATVRLFSVYQFASYFMSGVVAWMFIDKIRWGVGPLVLCLLLLFAARDSLAAPLILHLCLPYVVLYVGFCGGFGTKLKRLTGDLSYGVYLSGYPLINVFISLGPVGQSPETVFLRATGASLVFAWLSWHIIERPALRLKLRRAPTAL